MSKIIWEWVQGVKGDFLEEPQIDSIGPETGTGRVCRGGGWNWEEGRDRGYYYGDNFPVFHYCSLGPSEVFIK